MLGNSLVAAQLAASEGELNSTEWVGWFAWLCSLLELSKILFSRKAGSAGTS
jgi:hypothetical protein